MEYQFWNNSGFSIMNQCLQSERMEDIRKLRTSKTYPPMQWNRLVGSQIDISQLITQLKDYGQTSRQRLNQLIDTCQHLLYNEPNMLHLRSPFRIVGDIHGQFHDLLYMLQNFGDLPQNKYLFLGDYVDRGLFCIEVMTLLIALKCKYPKSIYLLRGNHQGKTMTQHYNFKLECVKKYDTDIYDRFLELFCKLPLSAIVDNKYFCVHGGISPELKKLKQLNSVDRFKEVQPNGLMCDLLWSDPINSNAMLWEKNKNRSCAFLYSKKHAEKFINQNKIQMIIRAHQVQNQGFSYQTDDLRKKLTLTIFSAPNYCNTYKNKGGIAIIDKNNLSIENFEQSLTPFVFKNYMNVLQWSLPMIATQTSKIFLHLFKSIDQNDQSNLTEEQINTLGKLQSLYNALNSQKQLNFKMLLNSESKDNQIDDQCKQNSSIQKYLHEAPVVIGPKKIEFKRIEIKSIQNEDDIII